MILSNRALMLSIAFVVQITRRTASRGRGRAARRTPAAKGCCAHTLLCHSSCRLDTSVTLGALRNDSDTEPATDATRQRRVDKSSDWGCSAYAPSSRSSGASCTSLIPIARLRRQPVGAGTLTVLQVLMLCLAHKILDALGCPASRGHLSDPKKAGRSGPPSPADSFFYRIDYRLDHIPLLRENPVFQFFHLSR